MRRVRILEGASEEAEAAAAWYELQQTGLGVEFEHAIEAALDLLELDIVPLLALPSAAGDPRLKRLTLRRFPFDLVVAISASDVVVIAFAHHARRPGYWRARLRR